MFAISANETHTLITIFGSKGEKNTAFWTQSNVKWFSPYH